MIEDPASPRTQAVFLKAHLKLMKVGMKNSQFSRKQMLAKASAITDAAYSNSIAGVEAAIADLNTVIKAEN